MPSSPRGEVIINTRYAYKVVKRYSKTKGIDNKDMTNIAIVFVWDEPSIYNIKVYIYAAIQDFKVNF